MGQSVPDVVTSVRPIGTGTSVSPEHRDPGSELPDRQCRGLCKLRSIIGRRFGPSVEFRECVKKKKDCSIETLFTGGFHKGRRGLVKRVECSVDNGLLFSVSLGDIRNVPYMYNEMFIISFLLLPLK